MSFSPNTLDDDTKIRTIKLSKPQLLYYNNFNKILLEKKIIVNGLM